MSSYATKLILDYAASCGIPRNKLLRDSDVAATVLMDSDRWLDFKDWEKLLDSVCEYICTTPYYVGYRSIVRQRLDPARQTKILQSIPFSILKQVLPHIIKNYINRNLNSVLSEDGSNIILRVSPIDINLYSKKLCEYNKGVCSAVVDGRLKKCGSIVKEITCVCSGDLCCTYSMDKTLIDMDKVSETITTEDIDNLFKGTAIAS